MWPYRHGLVVVLTVFDWQLDSMTLDVYANLSHSMILSAAASPVPSIERQSLPRSCWSHYFWYSQDTIGLLGCLGTFWLLISCANQCSLDLFHQAVFQPLCPQTVALPGGVVTQVQDSSIHLVEPHAIGHGQSSHGALDTALDPACPELSAEPSHSPADQRSCSAWVLPANLLRVPLITLSRP